MKVLPLMSQNPPSCNVFSVLSLASKVLVAIVLFLFLILPVVWERRSSFFSVEKPSSYLKVALRVCVCLLLRQTFPPVPTFLRSHGLQSPSYPLYPALDIIWLVSTLRSMAPVGVWESNQCYGTAQNSVGPFSSTAGQSPSQRLPVTFLSVDSCWPRDHGPFIHMIYCRVRHSPILKYRHIYIYVCIYKYANI